MIEQDFLQEAAAAFGFALTGEQLAAFDRYAALLVEYNQKVNLTAITQPREVVIKHFVDSLLLLKSLPLPEGASLVDVGTGAGFPGLPVAIARPDIKLTLLDSLQKRVVFLQEACKTTGVAAQCIHGRAEELGNDAPLRERFDFATARAVARLRELSEFCLPFVKPGGCFIALKGYEIEEELEEALPAIAKLGGRLLRVDKYLLPMENRRAVVLIKKISQTPPKFPRSFAKIKKSPLGAAEPGRKAPHSAIEKTGK